MHSMVHDGKCSLILSGGPNSVRNRTKELRKVFDNVANFMIFIGYPRSGHTLIGSLLDAHPHVVIANEFDVIGEWQDWKLKNRNKYYLFSQLYKNSQKEAQDGYRSSWANHRFDYSVPNQWQGKFQGSIKVCRGFDSHSGSFNSSDCCFCAKFIKQPTKDFNLCKNGGY